MNFNKHFGSVVCTLKKAAHEVRLSISKSYAKKQNFKVEFLALVPSLFEGEDSGFVSSVCPPSTSTPFNMLVVHPSVVARRMRQEEIARRLCVQSVKNVQRHLLKENKRERHSQKDEKRFSDYHVLMFPVIPAEMKPEMAWKQYALFCRPEIHQTIISAKKNLFIKKLNKLASEGRLAFPRRSVVAAA